MFINLGVIVNVLLVVLGLWWCKEVIGRWREDVTEFREVEDTPRKAGIIIVWAITALVALLVINFLYALAVDILQTL